MSHIFGPPTQATKRRLKPGKLKNIRKISKSSGNESYTLIHKLEEMWKSQHEGVSVNSSKVVSKSNKKIKRTDKPRSTSHKSLLTDAKKSAETKSHQNNGQSKNDLIKMKNDIVTERPKLNESDEDSSLSDENGEDTEMEINLSPELIEKLKNYDPKWFRKVARRNPEYFVSIDQYEKFARRDPSS